MTIILRKGATPEAMNKIDKKLTERSSKKGLDAKKYCGSVKFKEDGLALQKRLRSEWE